MKKLTFCGIACILALSIVPLTSQAEANHVSKTSTVPVENPHAQKLLSRLDEIKEMDKAQLNSAERKELRKEVRSIKKELKTMNQGVYLSVGAIIIIVLLLILLV